MRYRYLYIFAFLMLGASGVKAQVTADFDILYSPLNCAPAVVSFVNNSTGAAPLTYSWNFGQVAGTNSVQQNPSISYLDCGTYNVTLKVTDAQHHTASVTKKVTVYCSPKANFTVSNSGGCIPVNVVFNPSVSDSGSGSLVSYQWDFGDGVGSTNTSPSHTYSTQGCKTVTLVITNSKGCTSDTTIANAVCPSSTPIANFTSTVPISCSYPFNVTYTSAATGTNTPFTYSWSFQGGTPSVSTQANPVVTYSAPGTFWTQLIVSNATGCKDTIKKFNYVTIATNVANFTVNNTKICNPGTVFAQALNSQFATSLSWSCTGGVMSDTTGQEDLISFNTPGTYQLCLTMNFPGNCTASQCTTIVVRPTPSVNFSQTGNNATCQPPLNVTYTNTSGGTALTYQWFFPGGNPSNSTLQSPPVVAYTSCGNYNVQLVVTNTQGCADTLTKKQLVNINCPVASFVASSVTGCIPLDVTFNSTQSSGDPTKWFWNFGDATNPNTVQSTQQNPSHTYTTAGSYNVRLIIVNAQGCTDTLLMKQYINVGTISIAGFTANPTIACAGIPIDFTNTSTNLTPFNTYKWDFIKAPPFTTMSTAQSPTYAYNDTGTFDVSLITCYFGCCDTIIKDKLIKIKPPVAVISIGNSCITTHIDTLHGERSLGADTYSWSIPGAIPDTSNSPTPVVSYTNTGDYTVTLTVYNDSTHCTHTASQLIHIRDIKADFYVVDTGACAPYNFCFVSTSQDASTFVYKWYNTSGNQVYNSSSPNPCVIYQIPGIYTTELFAYDINGCESTFTIDSSIHVYGLTVSLTANNLSGCVPTTVNFTGKVNPSQTSIPVSYQWDFGDPQSGALNTATTINASHTFNKAGTYGISFAVTDNHGCVGSFGIADYITIYKPAVKFSALDTLVCLGSPLCFTDSTTGAPPLNFLWNFGDSTTSNLQAPCHVFSDTGKYTITLYATDVIGCKDTMVRPLYVRVISPHANFTADTTKITCPPLKVQFKDLSTDVNKQTVYYWDFGDGSNSAVQNPFHIYNKAGTYTVTLIIRTSAGCSDTLIYTDYITVLGPTANIATTITRGCPPQEVCFHATSSTSLSYIWNAGNGTVVYGNDTACVTYQQPGIFLPNVILSDSAGCTYAYPIDTINITYLTVGFKVDKPYICQYGTAQFTDTSSSGVTISSHQWNFGDPSSGPANTTTLQNPAHLFGAEGTYIVTETITNIYGCTSTATDTIHVTPSPTVAFTRSNPVCVGAPVQFTDSTKSLAPISSYNWNFGDPSSGNNNTSSSKDPIHIYSSAGTYKISYTVLAVSGCSDSSSTTITIHSLPNVSAGPAQTICFGTNTTLSASGATTYRWKPDTTLSNIAIPNPIAMPPASNTYYVTGTDNYGCSNSDSVIVTVTEPFVMQVSHGVEVCDGQSVQLSASGASSYQWFPAQGLDNPYVADPFATPYINTTYTVIGSDGSCFHDIDTVSVKVHQIPSAYAGKNQVILAGESAPIGMPYDSLIYSWSPPEGLICGSCPSTEAKPNKTTTYVITVQNKFGCRNSDSVIIMVGCGEDAFFVPNAFTPNDDGVDDVFYIRNDGSLSRLNFIRIFDRWGNLVYESTSLSEGWDGKYKGKPVAEGVYIYEMEVTCVTRQTIEKQGNITVLR